MANKVVLGGSMKGRSLVQDMVTRGFIPFLKICQLYEPMKCLRLMMRKLSKQGNLAVA